MRRWEKLIDAIGKDLTVDEFRKILEHSCPGNIQIDKISDEAFEAIVWKAKELRKDLDKKKRGNGMKAFSIALLFLAISCGKNDKSDPYLFEVQDLDRSWSYHSGAMRDGLTFTSLDLSNPSTATFYGATLGGASSNCIFSIDKQGFNGFYGSFKLTYVSGDGFICSKFGRAIGYEAVSDSRKGYDYLRMGGIELR